MKFSEETLNNWRRPPSDTEEGKLSNSEKMVREAIDNDEKLSEKSIYIFGQGSYANDTNVRLNSDIDINVRYSGGFYFDLPKDKKREEFGLNSPSSYSHEQFKNDVYSALVNKFGEAEVIRKDKCITVKGNANRVETDVVPTWKHRRYKVDGTYVEGTKFKADSGIWITNYPLQHIENGKGKNADTNRRFKRLTRIFRKLRYQMKDNNVHVDDGITSFLIECLIWNVPNRIFNDSEKWSERLRESIVFLYNATEKQETCKEWGEQKP